MTPAPIEPPTWFIKSAPSEVRGPYTRLQIQEFLRLQKINRETDLSKSRLGPFRSASQFSELSPSPPPVPVVPKDVFDWRSNTQLWIGVGSSVVVLGFIIIVALAMSQSPSTTSRKPGTNSGSTPSDLAEKRVKEEQKQANESPMVKQEERGRLAEDGRDKTFEEIVAGCEKSVCLIMDEFSSGTGFVIAENLVMTNRHVTEGMFVDEIIVSFPTASNKSRDQFKARIAYEDDVLDVAVLQLTNCSAVPLEFDLKTGDSFRRGRDILAIGFPGVHSDDRVLDRAVSRGLLSSQIEIDGVEFFQVSISINHGNSGGPILGTDGKVLGMATLKGSRDVEGIAYCIPAYLLRNMMENSSSHFASRLPKDEFETYSLRHDARVAVVRNLDASLSCLVRMEEMYNKVVEGTQSGNMDVQQAWNFAISEDRRKDHTFSEAIAKSTENACRKVASSPRIDSVTRLKIAELLGLYSEAQRYVNSPRGSLQKLHEKKIELIDKHVRLQSELAALLDMKFSN